MRNLSYGPLPFQPIAFGAAASLPDVAFEALPELAQWMEHRLSESGLFVSYCALRYESESYRESMQAELTAQYVQGRDRSRRRVAGVCRGIASRCEMTVGSACHLSATFAVCATCPVTVTGSRKGHLGATQAGRDDPDQYRDMACR